MPSKTVSDIVLHIAGPAVSLIPLIIASKGSSVPLAVVCLTSTLSLQAFCYAGFHAYVQVSAVLLAQVYAAPAALLLIWLDTPLCSAVHALLCMLCCACSAVHPFL